LNCFHNKMMRAVLVFSFVACQAQAEIKIENERQGEQCWGDFCITQDATGMQDGKTVEYLLGAATVGANGYVLASSLEVGAVKEHLTKLTEHSKTLRNTFEDFAKAEGAAKETLRKTWDKVRDLFNRKVSQCLQEGEGICKEMQRITVEGANLDKIKETGVTFQITGAEESVKVADQNLIAATKVTSVTTLSMGFLQLLQASKDVYDAYSTYATQIEQEPVLLQRMDKWKLDMGKFIKAIEQQKVWDASTWTKAVGKARIFFAEMESLIAEQEAVKSSAETKVFESGVKIVISGLSAAAAGWQMYSWIELGITVPPAQMVGTGFYGVAAGFYAISCFYSSWSSELAGSHLEVMKSLREELLTATQQLDKIQAELGPEERGAFDF